MKRIFDMPKEPQYELEVLDRAQDSHDSDEENAKSDVWVWCEREHDFDLERLKQTQQTFIKKGIATRVVEVTRRVI